MFHIYAPSIHVGGGSVLLTELIKYFSMNSRVIFYLDSRYQFPFELPGNVKVKRINNNFISRIFYEFFLSFNVKEKDKCLFFSNLPPLFNIKGKVYVYIQNRFLVDNLSPFSSLNFIEKLRIIIERNILRYFKFRVDFFYVQTITMKILTDDYLNVSSIVHPIYNSFSDKRLDAKRAIYFDFIYVASGNKHKNHINLLKAWILLSQDGFKPSLVLTLDENNDKVLINYILDITKTYDLKICISNSLPNHNLLSLYEKCRALIYPSLFESFGLPLLEAKIIGLPVLASELDYVRDIIDPVETFDPYSPVSIKKSVIRFMNLDKTNNIKNNITSNLSELFTK